MISKSIKVSTQQSSQEVPATNTHNQNKNISWGRS